MFQGKIWEVYTYNIYNYRLYITDVDLTATCDGSFVVINLLLDCDGVWWENCDSLITVVIRPEYWDMNGYSCDGI